MMLTFRIAPRLTSRAFPYALPVAFAAVFLAGVAALADDTPKVPAAPVKPASKSATATAKPAVAAVPKTDKLSQMQAATFAAINKIRRDNGLLPLLLNDHLTQSAHAQSGYLAETDSITHVDAQGHTIDERAKACGYVNFASVGENVTLNEGADDPVQEAVDTWMKDPPHRANLLNPEFVETGVGITFKNDTYYFAEDFGRPFE